MPFDNMKAAEEPLMADEADCRPVRRSSKRHTWCKSKRTFFAILLGSILPWVLHLCLAFWVLLKYQHRGPNNPIFPQLLYSPAQGVLEYEVRKFRLGLDGDLTEFQGPPSPELDSHWSSLYDMGINRIPLSMASKLPNKTVLFPHDAEKRYLIELDVFHQLHCLNMVRKALHPEYYKPHHPGPSPGDQDEILGPDHIDHCIDAIRQSLMCNADISVLTWIWNKKKQQNMEAGTILHTCRRFDKIQEWARRYAVYEDMDSGYREPNDPLDPETWVDGFSG